MCTGNEELYRLYKSASLLVLKRYCNMNTNMISFWRSSPQMFVTCDKKIKATPDRGGDSNLCFNITGRAFAREAVYTTT
jgi:hypothetical protein